MFNRAMNIMIRNEAACAELGQVPEIRATTDKNLILPPATSTNNTAVSTPSTSNSSM